MPKITDLTTASTVAGTEKALITQAGVAKLLLLSDLKEYVLPAASLGGNTAGSIVTTTGSQTLYFKTLNDVTFSGQNNAIANAQITDSHWFGGNMSAPAIVSPTITGTGTTMTGGTKSNGTIESDFIYDSFLEGCTVNENGVSKGAVVSENGTQTMANKAISASTIATCTIDSGSTIGGKTIADHLATKPDLVGVSAVSATLRITPTGTTDDSVTAAEIITALELGTLGVNKTISAFDITMSLYIINNTTYTLVAMGGAGEPSATIVYSGTGKTAKLSRIDLSGLDDGKTYYLALSCKIVSV